MSITPLLLSNVLNFSQTAKLNVSLNVLFWIQTRGNIPLSLLRPETESGKLGTQETDKLLRPARDADKRKIFSPYTHRQCVPASRRRPQKKGISEASQIFESGPWERVSVRESLLRKSLKKSIFKRDSFRYPWGNRVFRETVSRTKSFLKTVSKEQAFPQKINSREKFSTKRVFGSFFFGSAFFWETSSAALG